MTDAEDLARLKAFVADYTYKNLIAVVKSEEMSINFHQMELSKQKLTQVDLQKLSEIYAEFFVTKLLVEKKPDTIAAKEALEEALERLDAEET